MIFFVFVSETKVMIHKYITDNTSCQTLIHWNKSLHNFILLLIIYLLFKQVFTNDGIELCNY